jgi:hypothetical protein
MSGFSVRNSLMLRLINLFFGALLRMLYSRRDLFLENLALRQQLALLRSRHPRPRFSVQDKLFWVAAVRWWSGWKRVLVVVTPETVVRWHRAGFRLYWTWLSRHQVRTGRKCVSREVRELIFRMLAENPTWGAPRIHGELQMLGFDLSDGLSLDTAGAEESGPLEALVDFPAQSPRVDRFSLRSRPSAWECCTASLSSRTTVGAFCTST